MSSSRPYEEREGDREKDKKKVHYSSSTKNSSPPKSSSNHHHKSSSSTSNKPSSHRVHNSHDSGVGSSSASDRASIGTTSPPNLIHAYTTTGQDLEDQRQILSAVQEALGSANARIRGFERRERELSDQLSTAHHENRLLKKEKAGLLLREQELEGECEGLKARLRGLTASASAVGSHSSNPQSHNSSRDKERERDREEKRTSPPTTTRRSDERRRRDSMSGGAGAPRSSSHVRTRESEERQMRDRRTSSSWMNSPLYDTQPATADSRSNPFMPNSPISSTPRTVPVMPSSVAYSPAAVSYSNAPLYSPGSGQKKDPFPNDGRYHPYPL